MFGKPDYYIFTSDPHSTGKAWIELVEQAKRLYPSAQLVFGGDYIDGRHYARETMDYIMHEVSNGAIALRGNHEQMLLTFCKYGDQLWYLNGAKDTIKSLLGRGYSKKVAQEKLQTSKYYDFLSYLPLLYETKNIIFVHAGVKSEFKLYKDENNYEEKNSFKTAEKKMCDYFLWARENYWWENRTPNDLIFQHNKTGKTIVSGHTPTCFIYGEYENNAVEDLLPEVIYADKNYQHCPVKIVKYKGEPARIFTDNGCHGNNAETNRGNVIVLTPKGKIQDTFS